MKTKFLMVGALAAAVFTTPVFAESTHYEIDSGHTHVRFSVERFGFANTVGVFPESSGIITLDEDNPEQSRVEARVLTPSVWSGFEARDVHVRGPAWLNTEAHSEITFVSNAVELTGESTALVTGDLTIWGQSRPATFDVTLNQIAPDRTAQGREAAGFTMSGTINRSDYGHTTAGRFVGDEVLIEIDVVAHAIMAEE